MADLRKRVHSMLGQNNNLKNNGTVKHFVQEGFKRRTIYDIIKRYEIGLPAEDLPRSGHLTSFKGKILKRLQNAAANHIGVSQRKQEKHLKAPKYNKSQLEQVPKKCRKLRREITTPDTFIIVDDEKYFTFSHDGMPQNGGFYAFDKEDVPDSVKYKTKEKYPKKFLVWLALPAKGISKPYIGGTKGPAITADIYINKCLSKLRSFIEEHHAGDEYLGHTKSSQIIKKNI
ncbi:unnamed protein product [Rotaria socialis]|uniref:Uncharacterized protein n=1 Tax=Rotaria socialis TaxID=392032 RepID=A0A818X9T3_9BILA|nr:unnamed protein product [Rotaria socialis]CAF4533782.1 unnamed protein product [Rotaria socialis]